MRSGLVVSAMTMISRVMGLVRDVVVATFLGAGNGSDAFFVAFRFPNLFRRLFGEGATIVHVNAEAAERTEARRAEAQLLDRWFRALDQGARSGRSI